MKILILFIKNDFGHKSDFLFVHILKFNNIFAFYFQIQNKGKVPEVEKTSEDKAVRLNSVLVYWHLLQIFGRKIES